MITYVTHVGGTEHGIADGVYQHVGIAVAQEAERPTPDPSRAGGERPTPDPSRAGGERPTPDPSRAGGEVEWNANAP